MTHGELVQRAVKWLSGTMRCNPVYAGLASCSEIPDAIGWTSSYRYRGSIVVECKTSRADFLADKRKWFRWKQPDSKFSYDAHRLTVKYAAAEGYERLYLDRMGNRRYFMTPPTVVTVEMVQEHAPDHGLLWVEGRRVRVVQAAPKRTAIDQDSEIRYLRFAIINHKTPLCSQKVSKLLVAPQLPLEQTAAFTTGD